MGHFHRGGIQASLNNWPTLLHVLHSNRYYLVVNNKNNLFGTIDLMSTWANQSAVTKHPVGSTITQPRGAALFNFLRKLPALVKRPVPHSPLWKQLMEANTCVYGRDYMNIVQEEHCNKKDPGALPTGFLRFELFDYSVFTAVGDVPPVCRVGEKAAPHVSVPPGIGNKSHDALLCRDDKKEQWMSDVIHVGTPCPDGCPLRFFEQKWNKRWNGIPSEFSKCGLTCASLFGCSHYNHNLKTAVFDVTFCQSPFDTFYQRWWSNSKLNNTEQALAAMSPPMIRRFPQNEPPGCSMVAPFKDSCEPKLEAHFAILGALPSWSQVIVQTPQHESDRKQWLRFQNALTLSAMVYASDEMLFAFTTYNEITTVDLTQSIPCSNLQAHLSASYETWNAAKVVGGTPLEIRSKASVCVRAEHAGKAGQDANWHCTSNKKVGKIKYIGGTAIVEKHTSCCIPAHARPGTATPCCVDKTLQNSDKFRGRPLPQDLQAKVKGF